MTIITGECGKGQENQWLYIRGEDWRKSDYNNRREGRRKSGFITGQRAGERVII